MLDDIVLVMIAEQPLADELDDVMAAAALDAFCCCFLIVAAMLLCCASVSFAANVWLVESLVAARPDVIMAEVYDIVVFVFVDVAFDELLDEVGWLLVRLSPAKKTNPQLSAICYMATEKYMFNIKKK